MTIGRPRTLPPIAPLVLGYLAEQYEPATVAEIARGVCRARSDVAEALRELRLSGRAIDVGRAEARGKPLLWVAG